MKNMISGLLVIIFLGYSNRDTLLNKPLNLSDNEKKDLENFLLSLKDKRFVPQTNTNLHQ